MPRISLETTRSVQCKVLIFLSRTVRMVWLNYFLITIPTVQKFLNILFVIACVSLPLIRRYCSVEYPCTGIIFVQK